MVLDSHLKAMGPIYGSRPIGLLYFIGPSSKAALISVEITFDSLKWLKNIRVRVSCSLARSLGSRALAPSPSCLFVIHVLTIFFFSLGLRNIVREEVVPVPANCK
jgi:hypothetical protein